MKFWLRNAENDERKRMLKHKLAVFRFLQVVVLVSLCINKNKLKSSPSSKGLKAISQGI